MEEEEEEWQHTHSTKVAWVLASRNAGIRFMNSLVGEHKGAGLKLADEGLILLRCNSKLHVPCNDGGGGGRGRGRCLRMAQQCHGRAVGLKSAEEGLILLFFRCDSTLQEPTFA
jgi:hypothetical protein